MPNLSSWCQLSCPLWPARHSLGRDRRPKCKLIATEWLKSSRSTAPPKGLDVIDLLELRPRYYLLAMMRILRCFMLPGHEHHSAADDHQDSDGKELCSRSYYAFGRLISPSPSSFFIFSARLSVCNCLQLRRAILSRFGPPPNLRAENWIACLQCVLWLAWRTLREF